MVIPACIDTACDVLVFFHAHGGGGGVEANHIRTFPFFTVQCVNYDYTV